MEKILLCPFARNRISDDTFEIIRNEQLMEFAGQIEDMLELAKETCDFENPKTEEDFEYLEFLNAFQEVYQTRAGLLEKPYECAVLTTKYDEFISVKNKKERNMIMLALSDFDENFEDMLSMQIEDMNQIIKTINSGRYSQDWCSLLDFYDIMHQDFMSNLLLEKMAQKGDAYAIKLLKIRSKTNQSTQNLKNENKIAGENANFATDFEALEQQQDKLQDAERKRKEKEKSFNGPGMNE